MKHSNRLNILRLMLIILIMIVLLIPKYDIYEDGGTKTYTSLTYKVISWNQIEGKKGLEIYLFPDNFHHLDYYD